jgi:predicted  nucleic acid-binding Zn-ribbon protein
MNEQNIIMKTQDICTLLCSIEDDFGANEETIVTQERHIADLKKSLARVELDVKEYQEEVSDLEVSIAAAEKRACEWRELYDKEMAKSKEWQSATCGWFGVSVALFVFLIIAILK